MFLFFGFDFLASLWLLANNSSFIFYDEFVFSVDFLNKNDKQDDVYKFSTEVISCLIKSSTNLHSNRDIFIQLDKGLDIVAGMLNRINLRSEDSELFRKVIVMTANERLRRRLSFNATDLENVQELSPLISGTFSWAMLGPAYEKEAAAPFSILSVISSSGCIRALTRNTLAVLEDVSIQEGFFDFILFQRNIANSRRLWEGRNKKLLFLVYM